MAKDKEKSTQLVPSGGGLVPAATPEASLSRYLQEIRKYPVLEAKEEFTLAKDYAEHGNVKAAHKLVTSHLRLVAKIAMGYRGYGLPVGEVISEGNVGLMQAVRKFDPDRGFRLATYAMWWIRASIQEYILRSWSLVKLGTTSAQKKLFFNLRRIKGEINAIDGGQMQPDQVQTIADRLGVETKDVEMMDGRLSVGDQSLNVPMRADGDTNDEWQDWLVDGAASPESEIADADQRTVQQEILTEAMDALNDRERDILIARRLQDEPETLEVLSQRFDVSRERIRQIEARAFDKISKAIRARAQETGLQDALIDGATIDA